MITFVVILAILALVLVAGARMATRNPELERRLREVRHERDELGQLTAKLYEWGASGLNVPERAYVYEEISDVLGHDERIARNNLRHLTGKDRDIER